MELQASLSLLLAWIVSSVDALGVMEFTERPASHRDLKIPLDRSCNNMILIGDTTYTEVKGQSAVVQKPFEMDGDDVVVSQDVDFTLKTVCEGPDGFETELRVYFKFTSRNAALRQVCPVSLTLALTLTLVVVTFYWRGAAAARVTALFLH